MSITTQDQAYELVKDKISRKAFDERVLKREDDTNGLCDRRTAAILVLNEMGIDTTNAFDGSGSGSPQQTVVNPAELDKIGTIKPASDINFCGVVLLREEPRSYSKKAGGTGTRANMMIGDETGKIRLTLWDDKIGDAENINVGDVVEVYHAYAREWNNNVEASLGYKGLITKSKKKVKYSVKATPISKISPNSVVDIKGAVTGVDQTRDFVKKDGTAGRLCPVWVSDDTGRIRVTFWGENADAAAALSVGDKITVPDARAKESMRGDVELSASGGFITE